MDTGNKYLDVELKFIFDKMNICASSAIKYNAFIFLFPGSNIWTYCASLSDAILHCKGLRIKNREQKTENKNFNLSETVYSTIHDGKAIKSLQYLSVV